MKTDSDKSDVQEQTKPPIPRNNLLRSFGFAFAGIGHVIRTQRNFRIQIAIGLLVIAAAFWFKITAPEWAALLATMALVYVLEMINTALEALVDMVTDEYHPQAKIAKDVAAGAVLVAVLFAAGVGVAIFLPRIMAMMHF